MYKNIITLTILISSVIVGSNMTVAAQIEANDEGQAVSKKAEPKRETLSEVLSKTKETKTATDREVQKEAMAAYYNQKPKAPGKNLTTKSKILIAVGIAAAALGVAVIVWAANEK